MALVKSAEERNRNKVGKSLAEQVAEKICHMIEEREGLSVGEKLPNENDFSRQLHVSRTTLREAVRILVSYGILEIRRGKGTYILRDPKEDHPFNSKELSQIPVDVRDVYEIRLIFEPQTAFSAAKRATDEEIRQILLYGEQIEACIRSCQDRTEEEQAFHNAIAKATHNGFVERLIPIMYKAIYQGVILTEEKSEMVRQTLEDHRMIMEFLAQRDALGAKTAMELHIIHAMRGFGISAE